MKNQLAKTVSDMGVSFKKSARDRMLDLDFARQETEAAIEEAQHKADRVDDFQSVSSFVRSGRGWDRRIDGYNQEQEI